jgi:hypothetical protein
MDPRSTHLDQAALGSGASHAARHPICTTFTHATPGGATLSPCPSTTHSCSSARASRADDELIDELARRSDLLDEAALALPKITQADLYRSGVELLRTHKAEGVRRADVEGSWARVCRKAEKRKADVLLGNAAYVVAEPAQISLLLDGLSAFRTHIVITAERGTEGIDELIEPWTQAVSAAARRPRRRSAR